MAADLKLVDLSKRNVDDIPAMLETLAANIRSGEYGKVEAGVGVFMDEDGDVFTCGWGSDVDGVYSIGLLNIGAHWLAARKVTR
jgi:hypothetical protein